MKNIFYILCFVYFVFPAFAQGDVTFVGDDIIGIDVAFQFGGVTGNGSFPSHKMVGIGGRVGYHLGSIIFLDGEILHQPKGLIGTSEEQTVVLGGVRAGTVFYDKIGIFAKARAGVLRMDTSASTAFMPAKGVHPVFDYGIVAEYYEPFRNQPSRKFFIRLDIGGWMVSFRDTLILSDYGPDHSLIYKRLGIQHFPAFDLGVGVRF